MSASRPRPAPADQQAAERAAAHAERVRRARVESGRKGGQATKKKYGPEHFIKIGQQGGLKGGQITKERHGRDFYVEIGRKGGVENSERTRAAKREADQ